MITDNQIRTALRKLHEAEHSTERYMFFSNLQQIRRQCGLLLNLDEKMIESILDDAYQISELLELCSEVNKLVGKPIF